MDHLTTLGYPPEDPQGPDEINAAIDSIYNNRYAQGYEDGVNKTANNAHIEYVYHVHAGSSTSGGGCYTKPIYKNGNATNGFYLGAANPSGSINYYCNLCRNYISNVHFGGSSPGSVNMSPQEFCAQGVHYNCPKVKVISGYALNCGKSTSTIEQAVITF